MSSDRDLGWLTYRAQQLEEQKHHTRCKSKRWVVGEWTDKVLFHAKVCKRCGTLSPVDVIRLVTLGWVMTQSRSNLRTYYMTPPGSLIQLDKQLQFMMPAAASTLELHPREIWFPKPEVRVFSDHFTKHDLLALKLALRTEVYE